jgi:activator of 2-hydroxyglutaryl-CoA dehydratase
MGYSRIIVVRDCVKKYETQTLSTKNTQRQGLQTKVFAIFSGPSRHLWGIRMTRPWRRIGIDVGGTNTDAVLLEAGRVLHAVKVPTSASACRRAPLCRRFATGRRISPAMSAATC